MKNIKSLFLIVLLTAALRIHRSRIAFALLTLFLLAFPVTSIAQLALYDDFGQRRIDPDKWHGGETSVGASAPNAESDRNIANGQLRLLLTSYGETTSDIGSPADGGIMRLRINNPEPVTAMQGDVTVTRALAQGCPENTTASRVRAQLSGAFFNDGSSPGFGDQTGDVRASIEKRRDSTGADTILAVVSRCIDTGCDNTDTLDSFRFVTGWSVGVADTLGVGWDPANDRFIFSVNPGTTTEETEALAYTVSDANPPINAFKQLRILNSIANCTATRRRGSMTALFDNVMLNPDAVP
jgi:hypothetical protein